MKYLKAVAMRNAIEAINEGHYSLHISVVSDYRSYSVGVF